MAHEIFDSDNPFNGLLLTPVVSFLTMTKSTIANFASESVSSLVQIRARTCRNVLIVKPQLTLRGTPARNSDLFKAAKTFGVWSPNAESFANSQHCVLTSSSQSITPGLNASTSQFTRF